MKKGFTLIELLIVVAIVAMLATVVILILNPGAQLASARDTTRRSDMKAMQKALVLYSRDNGTYPSTGGAWWGECPSYGSHSRSGAAGYIPNLAPTYMIVLPTDPRYKGTGGAPGEGYRCYLYNSDGTDYKLLAHYTVETQTPPLPTSEPFYDPTRSPTQPTWAIYTSGASAW